MSEPLLPSTEYFRAVRMRPDRAIIRDEWIWRAIRQPARESVQADGRLLRVVLLPVCVTVHNAFFDRSYKP